MGFRDENEALRARIQALESENLQLEDALAERNEEPAARSLAQPLSPPLDSGSLLARVTNRESEELTERQRVAAERNEIIRQHKQRRPRVRVEGGSGHWSIRKNGGGVVTIDPSPLRDRLRQQLQFSVFLFFFPAIPAAIAILDWLAEGGESGALLMFGAAVVAWGAIVVLFSMLAALWKNPRYRLQLTDEHFALFKRTKNPVLFGKLSELKLLSKEESSTLFHRAWLSYTHDARALEEIDLLTADDANELQLLLETAANMHRP